MTSFLDELTDTGNWDPKPEERKYFRNSRSGNLGYLVRRAGKDMIRLDRPNEEILSPYTPGQGLWEPDHDYGAMSVLQMARVAFEADKQLCYYLGMHEQAKKEWLSLTDEQRQLWMTQGPTKHPVRASLYAHVVAALKPHVR
jgi:hypothetical protein